MTLTPTAEQKTDEVAKKFSENWRMWNTFNTGAFTKYKRPHTLTKKQVDWLHDIWSKQFEYGVSRDKARSARTFGNSGQNGDRGFRWEVSVHRNGSGTFEVLVKNEDFQGWSN